MCGGPKWKREEVPDHKFDFVDTREFTDTGFGMRMKYLWLYGIVLKSFLVYVSDIFSATTMLTTSGWSNQIFNDCVTKHIDGCIPIQFNVGKWIFVGCILFSFLLLAYETRKTKKIIASRDISYAYTNVMANHYYSLRSYDHFCLFAHIGASTKKKDDLAFFVFFTFKDWKRLLLADTPRQTINALTLYSIYLSKRHNPGAWWDVPKYFRDNTLSTSLLTVTTSSTVIVCGGSLLLLLAAGIIYVPLLCYIKGNMKEYVCHKVDKRIAEIIKRRNKERLAKMAELAKKEAAGDYSHLKNKKGQMIAQPLPQPTLPQLSVDDDDAFDDSKSRVAPSAYTSTDYYSDKQSFAPAYNEYAEYPPMPAYGGHGYDESQVNLAAAAAPMPYGGNTPAAQLPNPFSHYGGGGAPSPALTADAYGGMAPSPAQRAPSPYEAQYRQPSRNDHYGGGGYL